MDPKALTSQSSAALTSFHPLVQDWFLRSFTNPTDIQASSWPVIQRGQHMLITAPTGSGKTLTAFLWSINQFVMGELETGMTQVLYVSPLKALNNDIQRNLLEPLAQLKQCFSAATELFPTIRVQTRSGDTDQGERQRMLRKPPEILITTPESLGLLLTTKNGRRSLGTVKIVIMDEIHAVVDNRRGALLMVSLERLVEFAGEVQRIALSATVKPLDVIAGYVGGTDVNSNDRVVKVVESQIEKEIQLRIEFPEEARRSAERGEPIWDHLIDSFRTHIDENQSTLVFSNSRRQAERVALGLNDRLGENVVYSHHGSLAREIRAEVEERLKNGDLRAIIATSSLELGIDIGELDEVLLIQSPPSIASALQRIGRAGHRVGQVSKATLFPTHARDFIDAVVLAQAMKTRDIEPLKPLSEPLDLLAQLIVSMVATEDWSLTRLFNVIRRARVYANLSETNFRLVLEMLSGRYEGTRVRDLKARVSWDRKNDVLSIRKGAVFAFYLSGGTIPDRGYYQLRNSDTGAKIGELDEEFVWEAKVGQQFSFGSQQWRVQRITHNDVLVKPGSAASAPPFWRSEAFNRSFHYANLLGEFLYNANGMLASNDSESLVQQLDEDGFDQNAAAELVDFLKQQRHQTRCDLPHKTHVVAEFVRTGPSNYQSSGSEGQLVLHTCWGGKVNRPIGHALEGAWRREFHSVSDVFVDNHVIAVQLKPGITPDMILRLIGLRDFRQNLRVCLESSGYFGGRFRECAGRALLLTRQRFDRRMPLWMTRMQSKQLFAEVKEFEDFPVLLETWRTCLQDEFDIASTERVLTQLENGEIMLTMIETSQASPFAADIVHDQVNRYMYADDSPAHPGASSLSDELIAEAISDAQLRPPISQQAIEELETKLQRTAPGYQPDEERELSAWVHERVWINSQDWFANTEIPARVVEISNSGDTWLFHEDNKELVANDPRTAIANALQFYGPLRRDDLVRVAPLTDDRINRILDDLIDDQTVVADVRVANEDGEYICESRNLQILMRIQRKITRPSLVAKPLSDFSAFAAKWQRFGTAYSSNALFDLMEQLSGYTAAVHFWLSDIWRPRLIQWSQAEILQELSNLSIEWLGVGQERISVGFKDDLNAVQDSPDAPHERVLNSFEDPHARYTFAQLSDIADESVASFNSAFWDAVWAGKIASADLGGLVSPARANFDVPTVTRTNIRFRARRARGQSRGWSGSWHRVSLDSAGSSALMELEDEKERCRTLLRRYGVVTRELANREGGLYAWSRLFRALRTLELSGELSSGLFFDGMSGPQFVSQDGLQELLNLDVSGTHFWVSALDPVVPNGMGLTGMGLPARRLSNHCGFIDGRLAIVSENRGRILQIYLDPEDRSLDLLLEDLHDVVADGRRLVIETINNLDARSSPFLVTLQRHIDLVNDHSHVYAASANI